MPEPISKDEIEKIRAEVRTAESIEVIKKEIKTINDKLDKSYVTRDELSTYKAENSPYFLAMKSFIGMAVLGIIGALFNLVIK